MAKKTDQLFRQVTPHSAYVSGEKYAVAAHYSAANRMEHENRPYTGVT